MKTQKIQGDINIRIGRADHFKLKKLAANLGISVKKLIHLFAKMNMYDVSYGVQSPIHAIRAGKV